MADTSGGKGGSRGGPLASGAPSAEIATWQPSRLGPKVTVLEPVRPEPPAPEPVTLVPVTADGEPVSPAVARVRYGAAAAQGYGGDGDPGSP